MFYLVMRTAILMEVPALNTSVPVISWFVIVKLPHHGLSSSSSNQTQTRYLGSKNKLISTKYLTIFKSE